MNLVVVILQQDMAAITTCKVLCLGKLTVRYDGVPHIVTLLILEELLTIHPMLYMVALNNDTCGIPAILVDILPAATGDKVIQRTKTTVIIETSLCIGVLIIVKNLELATYATILADEVLDTTVCTWCELVVDRELKAVLLLLGNDVAST